MSMWESIGIRFFGGRISMCALKLGKKGKKVRKLQEKLSKVGYDPGERDGYFGYKTLEALSYLRKDLHLPSTGIADRQFYWYLQSRKNFSSTYSRDQDGVLKRIFSPKIGALGDYPEANFVLDYPEGEASKIKVLVLDETPFLAKSLLKIYKHPFYIAFHSLIGQRKTQVLALAKSAQGLIYLPWERELSLDNPILIEKIPLKIESLLKDFYWKDLYLAIPLQAFEWVLEPEKVEGAVRHSGQNTAFKGTVLESYPKQKEYGETISFLRKNRIKGRLRQGEMSFWYGQNRYKTVIKTISAGEIEKLLHLCDIYRLSGVVLWAVGPGEDRLWHLNIPKQL